MCLPLLGTVSILLIISQKIGVFSFINIISRKIQVRVIHLGLKMPRQQYRNHYCQTRLPVLFPVGVTSIIVQLIRLIFCDRYSHVSYLFRRIFQSLSLPGQVEMRNNVHYSLTMSYSSSRDSLVISSYLHLAHAPQVIVTSL